MGTERTSSCRYSDKLDGLDAPVQIDPLADVFLSEKELARRWGCKAKTLSNQRCLGTGPPFVKLGRCVRYRLSDVLAFEAAGRVQSGKAATKPRLRACESRLTPKPLLITPSRDVPRTSARRRTHAQPKPNCFSRSKVID